MKNEVEIQNKIQLFENSKIRSVWDSENEKWYFSVVDVIAVLTESPNPRKYWSVLKTRLKSEGSQLATNCSQLKMPASDGKMYKTDCMTTEQLLRLIQSIPSPKAEPFKLWLAKIGSDFLDEAIDPELSIDRAIQNYRRLWCKIIGIKLRKNGNCHRSSILLRKICGRRSSKMKEDWKECKLGEIVEINPTESIKRGTL